MFKKVYVDETTKLNFAAKKKKTYKTIFIVWIIGFIVSIPSIVGMLTAENALKPKIIFYLITSLLFIITGDSIAGVLSKRTDYLMSSACIFLGFYFSKVCSDYAIINQVVEENESNPNVLYIAFVVGFLLACLNPLLYLAKLCRYKIIISANIDSYRIKDSDDGPAYFPRFSYYYKGQHYLVDSKCGSPGKPEIDSTVFLYINPSKPNKFVLIKGFSFFTIFGFVFMNFMVVPLFL